MAPQSEGMTTISCCAATGHLAVMTEGNTSKRSAAWMGGCVSAWFIFFKQSCMAAQNAQRNKCQEEGVVDKKPRNKMKHSLEEIHQARYTKVSKMERSLKCRRLKMARKYTNSLQESHCLFWRQLKSLPNIWQLMLNFTPSLANNTWVSPLGNWSQKT